MGRMKMDGLAKKFLKSMQDWVDKRIPEKTKDCLRTKIAIIVGKDGTKKTYNVILVGDYETYLNIKTLYELGELSQTEYNNELTKLTLEGLTAIKTDVVYEIGHYVVIGIIDNKLTNAFILYNTSNE